METKSNHKIKQSNSTMIAGEDIVNGDKVVYVTNNYYLTDEELYSKVTNKNDYAESYKKYINNFQELNNYAIDSFFPCALSKKYEFTSDKLVFGKKIIDWIFGKEQFPKKEIQKFYESLKLDFDLEDDSILVKRWNANSYYFSNDFENANKAYSELYDEIVGRNDIPTWYIDDVTIDGRNILIDSHEKISYFDTKYYKRLETNKHKLSYPDIDRLKVEIYEDVHKTIFNNKNKGKYTTYYGIGLERCFSQIQDLIFMTILYGSITHLKIIRQLIANIMYMYAETFDDKEFYELTLKMLYLGGEFKKYYSLYEKIKLKHRFVNESRFINDLILSNDSLFEFEKNNHNIFIFKMYGYYLSDEQFAKLEEIIMSLLKEEQIEPHIKTECLNAIGKNMERFSKTNEIMDFIIFSFENKNSLYYLSFGNIINSIKISNLDKREMKKFDKILQFSLDNKSNINYDISHCIVEYKKYNSKVKKYDKLLNSLKEKTGLIYKIENEEDELEVIKEIINILKERHEKNEQNPGTSIEYMDDYRIGINIFEEEKFDGEVKKYFETEYLSFAESILLSKNETLLEKIKVIKLLIHLLNKNYNQDIKNRIISMIKKSEFEEYKDEYRIASFKEKNITELKINVMSAMIISKKIQLKDFLCKSLNLIMEDEGLIEEVLLCIQNIESYLKIDEEELNYLYLILKKGFQSDDYDIKNLSIELFNLLLSTPKEGEVLNLLISDCNEITTGEFRGYYQLLQKIDSELKEKMNEIFISLKEHKNYFIKKISIERL